MKLHTKNLELQFSERNTNIGNTGRQLVDSKRVSAECYGTSEPEMHNPIQSIKILFISNRLYATS